MVSRNPGSVLIDRNHQYSLFRAQSSSLLFLPGMIYVRDLSADSTWPTELAFLVTKSSYNGSHFDGRKITPGTELLVSLVESIMNKNMDTKVRSNHSPYRGTRLDEDDGTECHL